MFAGEFCVFARFLFFPVYLAFAFQLRKSEEKMVFGWTRVILCWQNYYFVQGSHNCSKGCWAQLVSLGMIDWSLELVIDEECCTEEWSFDTDGGSAGNYEKASDFRFDSGTRAFQAVEPSGSYDSGRNQFGWAEGPEWIASLLRGEEFPSGVSAEPIGLQKLIT